MLLVLFLLVHVVIQSTLGTLSLILSSHWPLLWFRRRNIHHNLVVLLRLSNRHIVIRI